MNKIVLKVEKGTFGYKDTPIISQVNFQVPQGSILGLIGPNGAGKSTLLETLGRFLPLLEGNIILDEKNSKDFDVQSFARRVAYLPQQYVVPFPYTVEELVSTGRYPYLNWWQDKGPEDELIIKDSLKYMQLESLADKPVKELSGGQRQRVFLAKILAQQTPVLFLDEPTGDLDFVFKEEVFRFASALAKHGKTIIMAVHEVNLAYKYCSQILLLGQGKVLAQGEPYQVMTEANLTKAYEIPIQVEKDKLTGALKVQKRPGEETAEEKNLLAKICKE